MQELAVISDIHSNLEALEAVLSRVAGLQVVCLGDVVGYGADPDEVVRKLRGRNAVSVLGNHDQAVVTGETGYFNARAAMAVNWTRRKITAENLAFLQGLPREAKLSFEGTPVYFTHGSPDDNLWEYVSPRTHSDLFGHYLGKTASRLIGVGHTHVPFLWTGPEGTVFNPGSVGQPRDGDWRASYATVSVVGNLLTIEHHRVEYDVGKAAGKIMEAGLPRELADRLMAGA